MHPLTMRVKEVVKLTAPTCIGYRGNRQTLTLRTHGAINRNTFPGEMAPWGQCEQCAISSLGADEPFNAWEWACPSDETDFTLFPGAHSQGWSIIPRGFYGRKHGNWLYVSPEGLECKTRDEVAAVLPEGGEERTALTRHRSIRARPFEAPRAVAKDRSALFVAAMFPSADWALGARLATVETGEAGGISVAQILKQATDPLRAVKNPPWGDGVSAGAGAGGCGCGYGGGCCNGGSGAVSLSSSSSSTVILGGLDHGALQGQSGTLQGQSGHAN